MAVGPNQLSDNFKEEVRAFEKTIDSLLMKKTLHGEVGGCVGIDTPAGMTESHLKVLRELYIAAGWKDIKRDFGRPARPW